MLLNFKVKKIIEQIHKTQKLYQCNINVTKKENFSTLE